MGMFDSWDDFTDSIGNIGDEIVDFVSKPFSIVTEPLEWYSDAYGDLFDSGGGGGDTPTPPSTGDAVNEWIKYLPQIYELQSQYAPKEMQQQYELMKQYMPQFSLLQQQMQQQMYPESAALQEALAKQASQGMNAQMPSWMQQQYRDTMNANLGTNAGSPIGADYMSRGMLSAQNDYNNYYRNLGLSATGRVPVTTPSSGQYSNYMAGFTPGAVGQQMGTNYGNYANLYGQMQTANMQYNSPINWLGGVGGLLSGIGALV